MAWTHCVQGLIMSWEKYKGLIVKMLHFCSLQLTIQSNSNLRIFYFFLKNSAYNLVSGGYSCYRGCSCWVTVWKMLPFRSPLRLPASRRLLPGPQCRCQQAGNSPKTQVLFTYQPGRETLKGLTTCGLTCFCVFFAYFFPSSQHTGSG